jgi:hypothetical protein
MDRSSWRYERIRHFISSRNVARALLDDTFTMVYDGRGTVRQDGNEVAHGADKYLVRDAVVHANPGSQGTQEHLWVRF